MVDLELFNCLQVVLKIILATVGFSVLITSFDFNVKHWCYSSYFYSKVLVWLSLMILKRVVYARKGQITLAEKIDDGTFL